MKRGQAEASCDELVVVPNRVGDTTKTKTQEERMVWLMGDRYNNDSSNYKTQFGRWAFTEVAVLDLTHVTIFDNACLKRNLAYCILLAVAE